MLLRSRTLRRLAVPALLALAALVSAPAAAISIIATGFLASAQVVGPKNPTSMTGQAVIDYDPATMTVAYELTLFDVATIIESSQLHLAPAGQNGPVVSFLFEVNAPFITAAELTFSGTASVNQDIEKALLDGNIYIDVHVFDDGDIRGQLVPEPTTALLLGLGLAALAVRHGSTASRR